MDNTSISLGLLGLGNIGGAVYRLLGQRFGGRFIVRRALVRDAARARPGIPADILTTDPAAVVESPEIDIVVEFLGGEQPAADYLLRALKAGKAVVTANKAALACRWRELHDAARASGAGLYYEAACCAGIPVIGALRGGLEANEITTVAGVVNGTTNFILSEMDQKGLSYVAALSQAQQDGLAEPDPTADVMGIDAANKLSILLSLAWGGHVPVSAIPTAGINTVDRRDLELGRDLGLVLKLIACGQAVEGQRRAFVRPAFVPKAHPLAVVSGGDNAVFVTGDPVGRLTWLGAGAGQGPTASGVVGDILCAAGAAGHQVPAPGDTLALSGPLASPFYLRVRLLNEPEALAHASAVLAGHGVTLDSVRQVGLGEAPQVAAITHAVAEPRLLEALARLGGAGHVEAVYPVLDSL